MGDVSPSFAILGDVPPESVFKENFLKICQNVQIVKYLQNKVRKIQGEIGILG